MSGIVEELFYALWQLRLVEHQDLRRSLSLVVQA
jgi:hypothetical protein